MQVTLAGLAEKAALLPFGEAWTEVLAAFGAVSFLAALLNAIPFVKFDGYIALMALTNHNFLRRTPSPRTSTVRAVLPLPQGDVRLPEQRWMRWYGLGCILFPGYLVASAMWFVVG